ncbi:MAG: HAMP domain-containing protein, partial [Nevskia sp.]|nr:HAMP domain-containing protein [Nevskia sp.]
MKIKTKLFASTGLLLSGVAIIAVASAIALQGIEASVHKLTDESAPLQLKTLELQQTIEKLSANFFKLGLSGDRRQAEELSTTIDGQIAAIGSLKDQIESLQKGGVEAADTAGFREIHSAVKQAVQQRLQDTQVFSAEAANVDQVLKSIAGSIDAIKGGLDGLGAQATAVVAQAQQSDLASNNSIQKLGDLRAHVKDLIIIVGDIGTVANRYRLEPLRERLTAVGEAVHAIHAEEGDPAVVKEVQDAVAQVSEQMTRDGDGLLALRAQVLASKDAEPQYLSLKGGIVDALDGLNAKMLQAIDPLELRLVEDRKKLETAYGFMESAARIKDASSAVNSDVKELNTELRLVMLSNSGEELDRIVADSQRLAARARANVEAMKKGVLQARQPKLAADADAIGAQLRNVDAAGAKIVAAKRSVLASDVALQQIIERVKASSRRQESSSAQQVQSIGDHQREVVALVRASVNRSFVIILAVSLALFAGGIVISTRIGLSITRPLSRLSQTLVAAAHSGDFTARVAESGRDEVSQAVRAFNQLMQSLQAALGDTNRVIAALAQGDFSRRIEAQVSGDLEVLKNGVNASLDQVQATMATLARAMAALADGKLDARIDAQATGEFRHLLQQAAQTVQAVQQMANDVRALVQAGSEGRLDARADAGRHQGDYRRLVESINALLDAVAAPVAEVPGVRAARARGDLQQQMSGRYAGTFG